MKNPTKEAEKQKELQTIIHNWFHRQINIEEYLLKHDLETVEWVNREGLCILLNEYMLDTADSYKLDYLLTLFTTSLAISSTKVQSSLVQCIREMQTQLDPTKRINWNRHQNVCNEIRHVIGVQQNVFILRPEIIEQMLDYLAKLLRGCNNKETIQCTIKTLLSFSVSQIESMLTRTIEQSVIEQSRPDWIIHLNLCCFIKKWFRLTSVNAHLLNGQFVTGKLLLYLLKQLNHTRNMDIVLNALLAIENICLSEELHNDIKFKLMSKLKKFNNWTSVENRSVVQVDHTRNQVGFCAQWLLANVLEMKTKRNGHMPPMKLLSNVLIARNEYNFSSMRNLDHSEEFTSVCCSYAATSGVHFYEATLLTDGMMRFGWTTNESRLTEWGIGEDEYSIGLDAVQICHLRHKSKFGHKLSSWKAGDVIGCLIDFANQRFGFYHNGQAVRGLWKVEFSSQPYYSVASLTVHQQCEFNFGKLPFKFEPKGYKHLNAPISSNASKHQLLETVLFKEFSINKDCGNKFYCWSKQLVVNNKVEPFFRDKTQKEYEQVIKQIEVDIQNGKKFQQFQFFNDGIVCKFHSLRLIQAIIEVMGSETKNNDKFDLLANAAQKLIAQAFNFVPQEKLCELIYPYLQLQVHQSSTENKHRNICLVLSIIINHCHSYNFKVIKYLRKEVFIYLTRTLCETRYVWTKIFALIALEHLELSEDEKSTLVNIKRIVSFISKQKQFYEHTDYTKLVHCDSGELLQYQLAFCCDWFYGQVLNLSLDISTVAIDQTEAILNPFDTSDDYLKLSSDFFTARSDCNLQSVRSVCQVNLGGAYYFEVIFLTNGPMQIGWANKLTNLRKCKVGGDEYSIAFDGYNGCVWHNSICYQATTSTRWQVGDVVGCLIDTIKKRLDFYLNDLPIEVQVPELVFEHFFSNLPCHVAVSLSSYQQCHFNFGKFPFKHSPRMLDYSDLYFASQIVNFKNPISTKIYKQSPEKHESLLDSPLILYHKWSVENFSTLFLNKSCPLSVIYSDSFPQRSSSQLSFSIRMLPTFSDDAANHFTYVSLYLYLEQCQPQNCSTKVKYQMSLIDVNGEKRLSKNARKRFRQENSFGWDKFVRLKYLLDPNSGLLINDRLTILAEVEISYRKQSENDLKSSETIIFNLHQSESQFNCNVQVNRITNLWEIRKFSSYYYDETETTSIQSEQFPLEHQYENKYRLSLWPNGVDEQCQDYVSLFLFLESSTKPEIRFQYRLSIIDWKRDIFHTGEGKGKLCPVIAEKEDFNQSNCIGSSKYIPVARVLNYANGLLPEDTLTLYCEIEEIQENLPTSETPTLPH